MGLKRRFGLNVVVDTVRISDGNVGLCLEPKFGRWIEPGRGEELRRRPAAPVHSMLARSMQQMTYEFIQTLGIF